MAGRSRSVEFDLLVTGTEAGGRKVERLGEKFDDLKDKVERLDGTTARVKGIAKLEKDSDKLGATVATLAGEFLAAGKTVLKFASYAGLAAGAAGPLAIGLGAATVAVSTFAVETSGAALALLPLAAGALLVQRTLVSAGPAMLQAIEPLTKEWEKQQLVVGKLATQGVEPLAKAFARGNFHVIGRAQERIAEATNRTLIATLKWLNTTQAQKALAAIGDNTAKSFERLAPSVGEVAKSLVLLASRVSGVSFDTFTDVADRALRRLREWIDTLGRDDVARGFGRIKQASDAVVAGFRAIANAIQFVEENRQKILQLSDAILALTAVGAALTGGWVVALGASLLLLARHWDDVTAAAREAGEWFESLGPKVTSTQGTIESLRGGWERLKSGFKSFVDQVGPKVAGYIDSLTVAFIKAQPIISVAVDVLGRWYEVLLKVAGFLVGAIYSNLTRTITVLGEVAHAAGKMAQMFLGAFAAIVGPMATVAEKLRLPFAKELRGVADDARAASSKLERSLNAVDTDLAQKEVRDLQGTVNRLKGKTVKTEADKRAIAESERRIEQLIRTIHRIPSSRSITVTTYFDQVNRGSRNANFDGNRVTGGGRAHGGPVTAGRTYIVGENQPELFVPKTNGTIIPKVPASFPRAMGGGGGNVTIVIQAPNYVGDKRDLVRALDDLRRSGRLPKAV